MTPAIEIREGTSTNDGGCHAPGCPIPYSTDGRTPHQVIILTLLNTEIRLCPACWEKFRDDLIFHLQECPY